MDNIEWLQHWYEENCNGLWEHTYGLVIETLDNPGWHVKIDLVDTKYKNSKKNPIVIANSDYDWISCNISDGIFHGFGDIHKLNKIIEIFRHWMS